ncbi:MAG TPA: ribonuclease HII [Balneolaceae bacterium]|nr:ribonuclease HII [Balneolaceae bacterium]
MNRLQIEEALWDEQYSRIMGLDEVGRGCLSGPVVAAGVILKPGTQIKGLRDSKQLSLEQRLTFEKKIKTKSLYWTIQWCEPSVIDEINILQASLKAMQKCTQQPGADPDYLLIDGKHYRDTIYPHQCLVGGDDRSLSIAAASVLAKVHRDNRMKKLHEQFPHYGWDTNVGYPTKQHFEGLKKYGITRHHRRSFRLRTDKEWDESSNH